MSLKTLFAREICIRLSDDLSAFVCTVRLGRFRMKSSEFVIEDGEARLVESSHSYVFSEPTQPRYHLSRDSESEPT